MAELFAERFLVTPEPGSLPVPDRYDEARGLSLSADGRPFIEADAELLDTHTVTFTDAESSDDDRDRVTAAVHTETRAAGEQADAASWARTETAIGREAPDIAPTAWAYTETKAMGEPHDHSAEPWLTTITKADGEPND
ncbi:hypothetical protein [Baekduia sp.]|jgi:hypothetical protein|uniref:hypothetical protein n=1 Tax=Baekduia sp. TaxID=2600305 RepID=UPI002DF86F8C|nr:hypothetical protein [Baekduia sp.]